MFGRKKQIIEINADGRDALVCLSEEFVIDKNTYITVPGNGKAILFANGKPVSRVPACDEKNVVASYGKDLLGKRAFLSLVSERNFSQAMWGFGCVSVDNKNTNQTYTAGANGHFGVEIRDYTKLITAFNEKKEITIDDVRERCISAVKAVGAPLLSRFLSETDTSALSVGALTPAFKLLFEQALSENTVLSEMGVALHSFEVDGFHIDDEDLRRIKDGPVPKPDYDRLADDITARVTEKIYNEGLLTQQNVAAAVEQTRDEIISAVTALMERQLDAFDKSNEHKLLDEEELERLKETLTPEVDYNKLTDDITERIAEKMQKESFSKEQDFSSAIAQTREEIMSAVSEMMGQQLETFGSNLSSEINEMVQERYPLYEQAEESNLKNITLTADNLLDCAENEEDLILPAAVLFSNVEDNLIHKFNLEHQDKTFVISYEEYNMWVEKAYLNGKYLLKTPNRYGIFVLRRPRTIKCDSDGKMRYEMPPLVRFMKAGLSVADAKKAEDMWCVINWIRHRSDENKKKLEEMFPKGLGQRKEYLSGTIAFYRKHGLYTKD